MVVDKVKAFGTWVRCTLVIFKRGSFVPRSQCDIMIAWPQFEYLSQLWILRSSFTGNTLSLIWRAHAKNLIRSKNTKTRCIGVTLVLWEEDRRWFERLDLFLFLITVTQYHSHTPFAAGYLASALFRKSWPCKILEEVKKGQWVEEKAQQPKQSYRCFKWICFNVYIQLHIHKIPFSALSSLLVYSCLFLYKEVVGVSDLLLLLLLETRVDSRLALQVAFHHRFCTCQALVMLILAEVLFHNTLQLKKIKKIVKKR